MNLNLDEIFYLNKEIFINSSFFKNNSYLKEGYIGFLLLFLKKILNCVDYI